MELLSEKKILFELINKRVVFVFRFGMVDERFFRIFKDCEVTKEVVEVDRYPEWAYMLDDFMKEYLAYFSTKNYHLTVKPWIQKAPNASITPRRGQIINFSVASKYYEEAGDFHVQWVAIEMENNKLQVTKMTALVKLIPTDMLGY